MSEVHLLVTATASFCAAAAFAFVGWELSRRPYDSRVQLVGFSFTLWWFLFAGMALSDALRIGLGLTGDGHGALYIALARLKIVMAAVAIWALGHYVLYLWTGSSRWSFWLAGFAAAHGFYYLYAFELREPVGYTVGTWSTRLELAAPGGLPPLLGALALVFFFAPFLALAVGYLAILPRLSSRTQRYRVGAIAAVVIVWHLTGLAQFDPDTSAELPVFAAFSALNVLVALLALMAYHPPRWLHDKLGIRPVEEEADRSPAEEAPVTQLAAR